MIKYIVDNMLIFEPDERLLHLKDNPAAAVDIGIISARLFEVLLTHPEGVTRGYLLDSVWMAYGLKPTNSNLNNHISILRRNLASLTQMDDLITTLPKKGFVLNKKYRVCQLDDDTTLQVQVHEAPDNGEGMYLADDTSSCSGTAQVDTLTAKSEARSEMRTPALTPGIFPHSKRIVVYIVGAVVCFVAAIMFYSWNIFMDRKSIFFQYNNCSFKPLRPLAQKDKQYTISLVMNHIYQDKINCSTDDYDIYFYFSGRDKHRSEFRFYSICRLDEKRRYAGCHTARFS